MPNMVKNMTTKRIGNPDPSVLAMVVYKYNFDTKPAVGGKPARDKRQITKAVV